jgi:drug/metabolite transporter (DMT)-like permease
MQNNQQKSWIVLIMLAITWGSSFILMKKGLLAYDNVQVGALRMIIASAVLLPFCIKHFSIIKKYWLPLLLVGLFGNGLPSFLFTKAQTVISSSLSGMLNALTPVFALTIGTLFFREKLNAMKVIGLSLGAVGVVLLLYKSGGIGYDENIIFHSLYVVFACVCYAISINIIRHKLSEVSSLLITSAAFMFIGLPCLIIFLTTDIDRAIHNENFVFSTLCIIILALVGTAIAVIAFNYLIKWTSSIFAASVTYLIPIVAILWGIFDSETISIVQSIGMAMVLVGVYIINRSKVKNVQHKFVDK